MTCKVLVLSEVMCRCKVAGRRAELYGSEEAFGRRTVGGTKSAGRVSCMSSIWLPSITCKVLVLSEAPHRSRQHGGCRWCTGGASLRDRVCAVGERVCVAAVAPLLLHMLWE